MRTGADIVDRRPRAIAGLAVALFLLAGSGCGGGGEATRRAADLVLVVIDTLRADHLGCYGYPEARTRTLDRLARGGLQYARAFTQVPVTAPSISTILTGSYPPAHGVRDNGIFAVDLDRPTLAEELKGAGYRTAGFVSAAVLDAKYGLNRGFDQYDDDMSAPWKFRRSKLVLQEPAHQGVERRGEDTVARALPWIRSGAAVGGSGSGPQPFFAFVHLFDPHDPYDAPEWMPGDPYDAEITYTDRVVGDLVRALERDGRRENTVFAVTADHGEALGEHGEMTHGFFVYDATMHVPWILSPAGARPGVLVESNVRHVDLAPTLLALTGHDSILGQGHRLGQGHQAKDVRPYGPGWEPPDPGLTGLGYIGDVTTEHVYGENLRVYYSYQWAELTSLRDDRWKLIRAPRPELYDLAADPGELRNLYDEQPGVAALMDRKLEDFLDVVEPDEVAGESLELDDETRRQLEALGYLGSDEPVRTGPLPDPKDAIDEYERRQYAKALILQGRQLLEHRQTAAAESLFAEAVDLAPEYPLGFLFLGEIDRQAGRLRAADRRLTRATELDDSLAQAWSARGTVAWLLGRPDDALDFIRRADEISGDEWARRNLLEVLVRRGDWEEALTVARRSDGRATTERAFVLGRAGRFAEEEAELSKLPNHDLTRLYRLHRLRVAKLDADAFAALDLGRHDAALSPLEALLRRAQAGEGPGVRHGRPDPALVWATAECRVAAGNVAGALELLRGAATDEPVADATRLAILAWARIEQGEPDVAAALLEQAYGIAGTVYPAYTASHWWLRGRAAAAGGAGSTDEAPVFHSKALEDSFGQAWETDALRGGGRSAFVAPGR